MTPVVLADERRAMSKHPQQAHDGDDWPFDFGGPTVGYCSRCGEARDAFYTCRNGGETVPEDQAPPGLFASLPASEPEEER